MENCAFQVYAFQYVYQEEAFQVCWNPPGGGKREIHFTFKDEDPKELQKKRKEEEILILD